MAEERDEFEKEGSWTGDGRLGDAYAREMMFPTNDAILRVDIFGAPTIRWDSVRRLSHGEVKLQQVMAAAISRAGLPSKGVLYEKNIRLL
jgi:hypothetical protein